MIDTLNQYDHSLMLWLNYDGGSILDAFWYAVSYKFAWVPLYVVILVVLVRSTRSSYIGTVRADRSNISRRSLILVLLVTVLIIVAADQLSSGLIKPMAQRLRPSHDPQLMSDLHYVNGYLGGRYGFVSSHAANTLALAIWVSLLFRRLSVWIAMMAFYLCNCYSRIYLGVHFPGDILGGSVVGACCAWLGYVLYRRFDRSSPFLVPASRNTTLPITLTVWLSLVVITGYAMLVGL